jgi:2-polyprenyl-3-methyl-5-hydroxy-6-metoxy-1,4-benzoquinol methylase
MGNPVPPLPEQEAFWNDWNHRFRTRDVDEFMSRQIAVAVEWVGRMAVRAPRVLELGCGTGWLSGALSEQCGARVVGIDLSQEAVEQARRAYPHLEFHAGDALTLPLQGPFDAIVSADVLAHIPDQQAVIDLMARLLRAGGTFVLMTQNPFVWLRSSYLMERGKGQYRDWPSLGRIRSMLAREFEILHVSSLAPGGDQGILRLAHSRYVSGVLRRIIGTQRLTALKERMLIGRELIVVARRVP